MRLLQVRRQGSRSSIRGPDFWRRLGFAVLASYTDLDSRSWLPTPTWIRGPGLRYRLGFAVLASDTDLDSRSWPPALNSIRRPHATPVFDRCAGLACGCQIVDSPRARGYCAWRFFVAQVRPPGRWPRALGSENGDAPRAHAGHRAFSFIPRPRSSRSSWWDRTCTRSGSCRACRASVRTFRLRAQARRSRTCKARPRS